MSHRTACLEELSLTPTHILTESLKMHMEETRGKQSTELNFLEFFCGGWQNYIFKYYLLQASLKQNQRHLRFLKAEKQRRICYNDSNAWFQSPPSHGNSEWDKFWWAPTRDGVGISGPLVSHELLNASCPGQCLLPFPHAVPADNLPLTNMEIFRPCRRMVKGKTSPSDQGEIRWTYWKLVYDPGRLWVKCHCCTCHWRTVMRQVE